jgi:hypothetical protein
MKKALKQESQESWTKLRHNRACLQIGQLAKNEWLLAAFHDRQELVSVISTRVRR